MCTGHRGTNALENSFLRALAERQADFNARPLPWGGGQVESSARQSSALLHADEAKPTAKPHVRWRKPRPIVFNGQPQ